MDKELKDHVINLLNSGIRFSRRKPTDYRKPISIEYGVIDSAEGSARVKIGDTEVLCGIKMEITEPYPDSPDQGSIIVGAELLPLSNPDYELGPPGIKAVELARVVDRGIRESGALDFKKLCIEPGSKAWTLLIDLCPINDNGNLFDAFALAVIAALKNTKYPSYDGTKVDYKEKTSKSIELEVVPISVTVIKIGNNFLVDPDIEEERVIDARLSVVCNEDGTLCALQKGGEQPLSSEELAQMVDIGISNAKELRKLLK